MKFFLLVTALSSGALFSGCEDIQNEEAVSIEEGKEALCVPQWISLAAEVPCHMDRDRNIFGIYVEAEAFGVEEEKDVRCGLPSRYTKVLMDKTRCWNTGWRTCASGLWYDVQDGDENTLPPMPLSVDNKDACPSSGGGGAGAGPGGGGNQQLF